MQSNPFLAIQSALQAQSVQLACKAINHLLTLEPTVRAHLSAHAGRTVLLRWEALLLFPAGEQLLKITDPLHLEPSVNEQVTPDVTVSLQAGLVQAPAAERLRFIRIEGDALLAQDLSLVAKQLRWDAEHDLARVIGGVPAHWVVRNAAKAAAVFAQAVDAFKQSTHNAVLHYPGWVVGSADMAAHQSELHALKTRIEALEKRLAGVKR
jgi:ubiquinone biosynthesis accessory factor UbiJ